MLIEGEPRMNTNGHKCGVGLGGFAPRHHLRTRVLRSALLCSAPLNPVGAPEARPEGSAGRKPGVTEDESPSPVRGGRCSFAPHGAPALAAFAPRAHARGYILTGPPGLQSAAFWHGRLDGRRPLRARSERCAVSLFLRSFVVHCPSPKRRRAAAVQDAAALTRRSGIRASVLDCASPVALLLNSQRNTQHR